MFEEGTIVYFDPFYFKNGNTAKAKYFVILKKIDGKSLLASLPTRKDYIPEKDLIQNGCIELPEINLNCFIISKTTIITTCGKKFDFDTHLYGHQIDEYEIELMNEIYPLENTDYVIWGTIKPEIFRELIICFKNSKSTKRKFKKLLNQ